jgi:hypothetical protein
MLRNVIWGIDMADGHGTFGGDRTYEKGISMPIFSGDWIDQAGVYGGIRVLSKTMQSLPYWEMSPRNGLVSGNRVDAFGKDGNHVIYAATGQTFRIDLPRGGSCTLTRIDPRTGSTTSLGTIPAGPYSVATPDRQDSAYRLTGRLCR